ncbi:hypothetical protein HYE34_02805 [Mycoplasmopsis bovis]|nr:hypothetical protein HYE34_02805 [Mycoplasmopsis bovis]
MKNKHRNNTESRKQNKGAKQTISRISTRTAATQKSRTRRDLRTKIKRTIEEREKKKN